MPKIGKVSAEKVVTHKIYGTPRKALAIKDIARKGTPREAATSFLKGIAPELKLPADLSGLKYDKVVKSPLELTFSFSNITTGSRLQARG